jgi:RND family efflux transporter MFP subunit
LNALRDFPTMPASPLPNRRLRIFLILFVGLAIGGGVLYAVARNKSMAADPHDGKAKPAAGVSFEVVSPKAGGIDRLSTQPGTIEAFWSTDVYAKVSGYLVEQNVDIGSVVKAGQVLARIAVPEYEAQVRKDEAEVRRATARRDQAIAAITTAEADHRASQAAVQLAQAEQKSKESYRAYRSKQRDRLRGLLAEKAIDAKLVDEQEDQYEAAASAELAAGEAVTAAKQKEVASGARVEQAKADKMTAEAEIAVTQATLDRSRLLVKYSEIDSPYDGIVTFRKYSPGTDGRYGDYIRPADTGGERTPMLVVERTDVMRLVVKVPDRDVSYVNKGDTATIRIDALKDYQFKSPTGGTPAVSRSSASQDPHSRTMKTEIDLGNPDGKLLSGMYGNVTINLQPGSPSAVRIPTPALAGKSDGGKGSVRVVREGKVQTIPVTLGADDGVQVEVLTGLTTADRVIVRSSVPVEDGADVVDSAETKSNGGH